MFRTQSPPLALFFTIDFGLAPGLEGSPGDCWGLPHRIEVPGFTHDSFATKHADMAGHRNEQQPLLGLRLARHAEYDGRAAHELRNPRRLAIVTTHLHPR